MNAQFRSSIHCRDLFKTLSSVYDGAFLQKSEAATEGVYKKMVFLKNS